MQVFDKLFSVLCEKTWFFEYFWLSLQREFLILIHFIYLARKGKVHNFEF